MAEEKKKLTANERAQQEFMEAWKEGLYWEKPWEGGAPYPCNWNTGKSYTGTNLVTLQNSEYLTFKQIQALGKGQPADQRPKVMKGEHGSSLFFYSRVENSEKDAEYKKLLQTNPAKAAKYLEGSHPVLKRYVVFRLDQIENLETKFDYEKVAHQQKDIYPIIDQKIEKMMKEDGTILHQKGGTGQPMFEHDLKGEHRVLVMGTPDQFQSMHAYYSTFFHELAHSNLDRQKYHFSYEIEECYAEMSAGIACRRFGLINDAQELNNNYAYIESWAGRVRVNEQNVKQLMQATNLAGKFADKLADGFDLLKFQEQSQNKEIVNTPSMQKVAEIEMAM